MKKLIIVGQIPPPFHGQSVMIKTMADGLSDRLDMELVPMRFSREIEETGRCSIRKVGHLIGLVFKVTRLLIKYPKSTLYYPPAPPKWSTVMRDWILLSCIRPFAGKTVFHFHAYGLGGFLQDRSRMKWLRRPFMKPDAAIVLGRLCRKDAEVINARQTVIIPYGIDIPVRQHAAERSDGFKRILFVGLHNESKGILDLLDTAHVLKSTGANFQIHTVGPWKDNHIQQTFEAKRHELGLGELVICHGELSGDQLWAEYAQADLFFFPTFYEYETFGVVVLEAMAHGIPVVASNWRGPGDVVENGVTGFLCPVHDIHAYADAIIKIVNDPVLADSMGGAGRELYETRYSRTQFINSIEQLFLNLG